MFIIISYQGGANQNQMWCTSHLLGMAIKKEALKKMWRNWKPCALL